MRCNKKANLPLFEIVLVLVRRPTSYYNSTRARERPYSFTVASTVLQIFDAKLRISANAVRFDPYFLAYRDAAKVFEGMSHQEAHAITDALVTLGVIEIASNGQPGLNSGEAAGFRYLLEVCKLLNEVRKGQAYAILHCT